MVVIDFIDNREIIYAKCLFVAAVTAMGTVVDARILRPISHALTVFHLIRASAIIYLPLPSPEMITHHQYHHPPWSPNNTYKLIKTLRRPPRMSENRNMTLLTTTPSLLKNLKFAFRLTSTWIQCNWTTLLCLVCLSLKRWPTAKALGKTYLVKSSLRPSTKPIVRLSIWYQRVHAAIRKQWKAVHCRTS